MTRHPMLWSFAIWAAVHILGNGDTAAIVFFGAFLVTVLAGMPSIDAKLHRRDPATWQGLAAMTSIVPFAAITQGRNRFVPNEIGWLARRSRWSSGFCCCWRIRGCSASRRSICVPAASNRSAARSARRLCRGYPAGDRKRSSPSRRVPSSRQLCRPDARDESVHLAGQLFGLLRQSEAAVKT